MVTVVEALSQNINSLTNITLFLIDAVKVISIASEKECEFKTVKAQEVNVKGHLISEYKQLVSSTL